MTETVTTEEVRDALRHVIDPELGADIVELEMVQSIKVDGVTAVIGIGLTSAACPLRGQIKQDATRRLEALGLSQVNFDFTELTATQKARTMDRARKRAAEDAAETAVPPNARVIGIASGKGGVGKSSISVNLAVSLAKRGLNVGLIDADIWGFSVPRMLGITERLEAVADNNERPQMVPARQTYGTGELWVVSMGLLVESEESALLWRGLMLNRAVQHFFEDVAWPADLDYVLIDLPPGTGDVAMGVARMLPRTEMLIVTTPALAAQKVAARAVTMAEKSYLRVVGVVENMSYFESPDGARHRLFGQGGGQNLADFAHAPLLASVPIDNSVADGGDHGRPVADGNGPASAAFNHLAERLAADVAPPRAACSHRLLAAAEAALARADAVEETTAAR